MTAQLLMSAFHTLNGSCDGASNLDGVGFNKFDAIWVRQSLDSGVAEAFSLEFQHDLHFRLRKYRKQLLKAGINYDDIVLPELKKQRKLEVRNSKFVLNFGYDVELVNHLKSLDLPKRPFFSSLDKTWHVVPCQVALDFAIEQGFEIEKDAEKAIEEVKIRSGRHAYLDGNVICVRFPYDASIVEAIKKETNQKYRTFGWGTKTWRITAHEKTKGLLKVLVDFDFEQIDDITAAYRKRLGFKEHPTVPFVKDISSGFSETQIEEMIWCFAQKNRLRPYQLEGMRYMLTKGRCFLADDMGLGKSIQTIGVIEAVEEFPVLIVCPKSLKTDWLIKIREWAPARKVAAVWTDTPVSSLKNKEIIIISYSLLKKYRKFLQSVDFKMVVADESQYIKNRKAQRSVLAHEIVKNIKYRFCLTGTPIMNRKTELVSQLMFLGILNDFKSFVNFTSRMFLNYEQVSDLGFEPQNIEEMAKILAETCLIRRTKSAVLKDLPEKQKNNVYINLTPEADIEYKEALDDFLSWLDKNGKDVVRAQRALVLVKLIHLKQICAKGKLPAILDWVSDFNESTEEKLLLFADNKTVQTQLAEALEGCAVIKSGQSGEDRGLNVQRFQEDAECRHIVSSLKAGGVGLTLTATSNVGFCDFGWNPGTMNQAEDRAHRIGQTKQVMIWNFVAPNTIDDYLLNLIEQKRQMIEETIVESDLIADLVDALKRNK